MILIFWSSTFQYEYLGLKNWRVHSHLNATIGSTFVARRAGIQQATSATAVSNKEIAMKVIGSVALTLNSLVFINGVSASDASNPIPTPANVRINPCRRTSRRTSRD